MKTLQTQSGMLMWTALMTCVCVGWLGCGPKEEVRQQAASDDAFTITIDRSENGATASSASEAAGADTTIPRALSFEMAGFSSPLDSDAPAEQLAAARHAAIIEAFCNALIEARRSRGQTDSDFEAKLGPRLTVTHCTTIDGYDVEVKLTRRGAGTTLLVRNGVLQHPPCDWQLIQGMFEETNGEFSLLGTERSATDDTYIAKVGCYLPERLGEALAGGVTDEESAD